MTPEAALRVLPPPKGWRVDATTRALRPEVGIDPASGADELAQTAWTRTEVRPRWASFGLVVLAGLVGAGLAVGAGLFDPGGPHYERWAAFLLPALAAFVVQRAKTVVVEPSGSYLAPREGRDQLQGTVAGTLADPDARPVEDDAPVAARLELTVGGGAAVTLVIGWCRAFEIALGDGRAVEIAAGPIELAAPAARSMPVERALVDAVLRELCPDHPARAGRPNVDPFPYEEATLVVIMAGDSVDIAEPLERTADKEGRGAFRTAEGGALVPVGVPCVQLRG